MGTLSADILVGFVAEARGYTASLRDILSNWENGSPGSHPLQDVYRQVQVLGSSAEMLGIAEVAALATPVASKLNSLIEAGADLCQEECQELVVTLDQIEGHLCAVGGEEDRPPEGIPVERPPVLTDLPAELVEIFTLEAREHSQTIQNGLERLVKDIADTDALRDIRRATHTLKGAAFSVGVDEIAHVAHAMEDMIDRCLEGPVSLSASDLDLLLDSADALDGLIDSEQCEETGALLKSIDERYTVLLGDVHTPIRNPETPSIPDNGTEPSVSERAESWLRLPLENVDRLINRVGEMVINRAGFERHVTTLNDLLAELDSSSKRLRRVTSDIDSQIESTVWTGVGDQNLYDSTFDPLELDRYTLLHQLTRELAEVTGDTVNINNELHFLAGDLDGTLTHERRLATELQDDLMAVRLVSFREMEMRLRRTTRRAARDLGKSVELALVGFDTKVDKTILNALADPLMHLLRNAVDHGIEMPEARKAAGKPTTGLVTVKISRERGRITVVMSDDGTGIPIALVRQRAVALGMLDKNETPDSNQILNLLFEEGFSMAEKVTQTSGRGVGLDIVRRAVRQLQGTVRLDAKEGQGTTVTITVPVTLAITRALFVHSNKQMFAVPIEQISGVIRLQPQMLDEIRDKDSLRHEGGVYSVYNLATFTRGIETAAGVERYGLVIEADGQDAVMLIDSLHGIHEAVVKSLGTHLRRVHGVSGATIAGNGEVVLILDPMEILSTDRPLPRVDQSRQVSDMPSASAPHALVVDDSISVRRVVCSFLERVGWRTTSAKDGIEALEKLNSIRPDVALVDIEMPRMNGYELLSRIKSEAAFQGLPVVFLTSRSAAKHRERARQLDVDGYLVKPYREDQLLEELTRAMRK
jgi:chemosensory pili system protein ChpA (sensor histidine kinase/response regulator)